MTLDGRHPSVEPEHAFGDSCKKIILCNTPLVDDYRLIEALPYIPYFELQVIASWW
jgi:hypothetical protein